LSKLKEWDNSRDASLMLTNEWLKRLIEWVDRLCRLENRTIIGSS
jgi:hypothetical protein